jgi:hypothetical protein
MTAAESHSAFSVATAVLLALNGAGCASTPPVSNPAMAFEERAARPAAEPADVPLSEAKDLVPEVLRHDRQTIVVQRPRSYTTMQAATCTPAKSLRVWWDDIRVCRTPNDAGSYE